MIHTSTIFQVYSVLEITQAANAADYREPDVLNGIEETDPPLHIINNILGFSGSYYPLNTKSGVVDLIIN